MDLLESVCDGRNAARGSRRRILPPNSKRAWSAQLSWRDARVYGLGYNFHASVSSLEQFRGELYRCDATQWREEAAEFPARKAARIRGSPMNKSHCGETIFTYIVCRETLRISFAATSNTKLHVE